MDYQALSSTIAVHEGRLHKPLMLSPAQCRAARALLNMTQAELANRSHLSHTTIRGFEAGSRSPTHNNLAGIRRALEEAGVRFTRTGVELCDDCP